ncbi:MAG: hypothetical protein QOD24_1706, partial [Solirubrobacteraceae bacterium]|nr:hypothetical protein [Solirubrobacteraceae bacterium]
MADGLLLASPAASWLGMAAGATGIKIPAGDPADLRKAAAAWGHVEEALAREAQVVERAALTAALADWQGIASIAFESRSRALCVDLRRGGRACRQAATACKRLAIVLHDAQDDAREAMRQAFDALDRIARAERLIEGARADAAVADQKVTEARAAGAIARDVPGGLGAAGAQLAQAREQEAHHEGRAARGRLARATEQLDDARGDLRRAQHHGEEANRRADEAGRAAAVALADVAAAARRAPARPAPPATPVTPGGGGLLDAVLAIVNPTVPIGTVRAPGVGTVDLNTTAGDIAGNGLTGQLAGATARAEQARAEALRRFPASANAAHPLTRGEHANLSHERM